MSKIKKAKNKILVLLDAHAIMHRAFHALPQFTSPDGEPTGALYGFSVMLLKIAREIKPDYIAAAYDLKKPTFRHEIYEKYKAHRPETDKALSSQFETSREILSAFNIPVYDKETYEADDVIGTIVERLQKERGLDIVIASGDLDTLQLVSGEKVRVYTLRNGIEDTMFYDENKVKERFGFGPEFVVDFKGLKGDPSDNIPGVAGIGEKTASDLIKKFGKVENIIEAAQKYPDKLKNAGIKERVINILNEKNKDAFLSKELALIKKNVPIKFSLKDMYWRDFDKNEVEGIFKKLGFASLLKRIPDYNERNIGGLFKKSSEAPLSDNLKLLEDSRTIYWALFEDVLYGVTEAGGMVFCGKEEILSKKDELIKIFLKNSNRAFDVKKILHFLHPYNITPKFEDDLKIMFWVLNPHRTDPQFDDVAGLVFPRESLSLPRSFLKMPHMFGALFKDVALKNLEKIYRDIEMPLIKILFNMEAAGIEVSAKDLGKLGERYKKQIFIIEKKIHELAGEAFNINSPKELSRVLFDRMLLPVKGVKKTGTGFYSTRHSELIKLKNIHPIIDEILKYREIAKLLSTYIEVLPKLVDDKNRIHTTFNQTGTVTGRLSSSDPNLQQVPNRGDLGGEVRETFRSSSGKVFFACDYSQIQLRIAAYLSKDKKMLSIFKEGKDIHTATAAEVFNVKENEVTSKMRRHAKVINFGILYGMGVNSLAQNLEVPKEEARKFLNKYFEDFSGLAEFFEKVKTEARDKGYIETIFGRRRYLPEISSPYHDIRSEAERMAVNMPIQGSEADIIKLAMVSVEKFLENNSDLKKKIKLILQIHDELLFEVDKDVIFEAKRVIAPILENIYGEDLFLPVETKAGSNWGDLRRL